MKARKAILLGTAGFFPGCEDGPSFFDPHSPGAERTRYIGNVICTIRRARLRSVEALPLASMTLCPNVPEEMANRSFGNLKPEGFQTAIPAFGFALMFALSTAGTSLHALRASGGRG